MSATPSRSPAANARSALKTAHPVVSTKGPRVPTATQLVWLRRGLLEPGGKLPLFDDAGQRVSGSIIRACRNAGWAEPWFHNPIKPSWEVCRLTAAGCAMLADISIVTVDFRRGR